MKSIGRKRQREMRGKTGRKKGGKTMDNIVKILSDRRFVLTGVTIIMLIGIVVNVADAPPLEATTAAIILCYQIDDAGRIIDGDGRVRGWMRGSEVYGPDLELKFRFEGRRFESVN